MHPPVTLSRADIDGVPVFWADTGGEPAAGLVFRVGRADETLATSGLTHLAEHLARYPLGLDTRSPVSGPGRGHSRSGGRPGNRRAPALARPGTSAQRRQDLAR